MLPHAPPRGTLMKKSSFWFFLGYLVCFKCNVPISFCKACASKCLPFPCMHPTSPNYFYICSFVCFCEELLRGCYCCILAESLVLDSVVRVCLGGNTIWCLDANTIWVKRANMARQSGEMNTSYLHATLGSSMGMLYNIGICSYSPDHVLWA